MSPTIRACQEARILRRIRGGGEESTDDNPLKIIYRNGVRHSSLLLGELVPKLGSEGDLVGAQNVTIPLSDRVLMDQCKGVVLVLK